MTTNQLHDWAQHLASRGWAVFPIVPGAQRPPAIRDWESRATTDPVRIGSAGQNQTLERIDFCPDPAAIYRATLPDSDTPARAGHRKGDPR